MLDDALALSRLGLRVFPLEPGGRTPLLSGWPEIATTKPSAIRSWWAQWPNANIGICTSGLLVVDIDVKQGKRGFDSLLALEFEGIACPRTFTTRTPSGGRHLFYRPEYPVRNGVDVLGEGLDIRGEKGYVVGPGSRTPQGKYVSEDLARPIAAAPPGLSARCRGVRKPPPSVAPADVDQKLAIARARAWLITSEPAVEGRGGDNHTYRTACRVRDYGVSEAAALEVMTEWNTRCVPPWTPEALSMKIANAYAYAENPIGSQAPEAIFEKLSVSKKGPTGLRTAGDVDMAAVLASDYLVKGWLDRGTNAILFGEWNAGKTFVALDLAAHLAAGERWFGCRVRPARVLYLGYEGLRALDKRVAALMRERIPKLATLPFAWQALSQPLIMSAGRDVLITILNAFASLFAGPPDLIIIDTLSNAIGGDDSDAANIGAYNTLVQELIAQQRCTVLTLHHPGRTDKGRERGHSAIPAAADTILRLAEGEITATKQRDEAKGTLGFELVPVELGRDNEGDVVTTCYVRQTSRIGSKEFEVRKPSAREAAALNALAVATMNRRTVSRGEWAACCSEGAKKSLDKTIAALLSLRLIEEEDGEFRCSAM